VGCDGHQFTELVVIIVLPPSQITEVCIGLVDFSEPLLSRRISAVLRVIFQSLVPIGPLNLLEACVTGYAQDLIISSLSVGILFVKECLFIFGLESVLIIELLEGPIGILSAVLVNQLIIVIATPWIRQHEIGFTDVRELPLSGDSAVGMFFRMPLCS